MRDADEWSTLTAMLVARLSSVACVVVSLSLSVARADQPAPPRAPDPAAGKLKAAACQACHVSADPEAAAPRLVGQRAAYIGRQLMAFKSGDRKHELMRPIAAQLSDADVADLAAYWSTQPAGSDGAVPPSVEAWKRPKMTFPKDFPRGFVVYRTESDPEAKVVAKSYVTQRAVAAARANKPLPDGTAILVVNYPAKLDDKQQPLADGRGGWQLGPASSYAGMELRAGWGKDLPALLRAGDWSFGVFDASKKPAPSTNVVPCLVCHQPASATSYVFTFDRIKAAP